MKGVMLSAFNQRRSDVSGYTLLELTIAIFLVAILCVIAIPAYQRYILRVKIFQAEKDVASMAGIIAVSYQDARAFPQALSNVGLDGMVDPWGRPYVYYNILANGKGHARKDHALNPINTDFDLYSAGPDGQTKPQITQKDSLDDIIRANDGRFIGVASDF